MTEQNKQMNEFRIEERVLTLVTKSSGWATELNRVSWGDKEAKYDIRDWSADHKSCGKGITLSDWEMEIFKSKLKDLDLKAYEGVDKAEKHERDGLTWEIIDRVAAFDDKGWAKEMNVISWNGGSPKLDIRRWSEDHEKMMKGVVLGPIAISRLNTIFQDYEAAAEKAAFTEETY